GHAGPEDEGGFRAFEHRHDGLGLADGGVVGPPIAVAAAILVVRIANEGRRYMDWRNDGAGRGIDAAESLRGERAAGINRIGHDVLWRWPAKAECHRLPRPMQRPAAAGWVSRPPRVFGANRPGMTRRVAFPPGADPGLRHARWHDACLSGHTHLLRG